MGVHLDALAEDEDLMPLWQEIHRRLCSGTPVEALATVRVVGLGPGGVAALRSWLDTSARRRHVSSAVKVDRTGTLIPVRGLLAALGISRAELINLVEFAVGAAVVDQSILRQAVDATRSAVWDEAEAALGHLPRLLARLRAAGVGNDPERTRLLISALAWATGRLPAAVPVTLAKLSHDATGNPHYLDLDELPGQRLVSAVAEILGEVEPARPHHVRAMLLRAGIVADRLWATVLAYNVHADGSGMIDERLRAAQYPVALTLLDLTLTPPQLTPGQILTVVENPSVLEAALIEGHRGALACTSGHLRAVDHAFLQLAVDAGVDLRYAGDRDAAGVAIADAVVELYGARLVAMGQPLDRRADGVTFQEHDEALRALFVDENR